MWTSIHLWLTKLVKTGFFQQTKEQITLIQLEEAYGEKQDANRVN